jgi:hypothetical protein
MKVYIAFIIVSFLFSCSSNQKKIFETHKSSKKYLLDTIHKQIPTSFGDGYIGGIDLIINKSSSFSAYNFCKINKIKIIDNSNNKVLEFPNFNPLCDFNYVDVKDSFIICLNNNQLFKIDKFNNSKFSNYNLTEFKKFSNSGLCSTGNKPGSDQRVNVSNEIIFFRTCIDLNNDSGIYSKSYFKYPSFCKLNLKTFEFNFYDTGYAPVNDDFNDLEYDLYVRDSIILSYGMSPKILVINTTNKKRSIKFIKSKFDLVKSKKLKSKNLSDKKNQKYKNSILNPFYESLFYNPYNKKYYRIFHPFMEEFDENGLENTYLEKKSILMVFDENLNLLDEFILPVNSVSILKLFPIKNGIEILLPDLTKENNKITTKSFLRVCHE